MQPPGKNSLLQVVYANSSFKEIKKGSAPIFFFARNPQDENNWTLLEINYFHKGFNYGNPYTDTLPNMSPCPEIKSPIKPTSTPAPTRTPQPTKAPIVDEPPHDAGIKEEEEPWWAFLKNLIPKAQASLCNDPRPPITDGDDNFIQCTEYVAQIRPDALCWLRTSGADAKYWDNDAKKYGADMVKVDSKPQVGDIVVFESSCSRVGASGHVAIVTNVEGVSFNKWVIDIKESNGRIVGAEGTDENIEVEDCMSFIHMPYVGFEDDPQQATPIPEVEQPPVKPTWWDAILCFFRIKKCN